VRRRNFLTSGLALPFLQRLSGQRAPVTDAGYHLHPHYRSESPLESTLRKVDAGADDLASEKFHDQIAPILGGWSAGLRQSPRNVQAIASALATDFAGSSLEAASSKLLRQDAALQVVHLTYGRQRLDRDGFPAQLGRWLSAFSELTTADFTVTRIEGQRTRVRYELVGGGPGFHREQRVGTWEMDWDDRGRIRNWTVGKEMRSRSAVRWYADITEQALGHTASWANQMSHGVDYWRTVLDGACGIDVYGHNGVAAGDVDGDGFDDLYVCQPAGLPNRLYRNRGDGTFEDITANSGVGLLENTACGLFVDVDNDGRQDLVVVRAAGPLLFLNDGGGKFRLKADAFHFANPPQGTFTGVAAADYDRDGWLDIYFCLYTYYQGADQYNYPVPYYAAENGPPNFLMRNQRDGTFRDVTKEAGLDRNNTRYSFCCAWGDANGDGWPDLYVVNDFGLKNLYRNNGDGTFHDVARESAVEDAGAGMGVCWFDYDNDGAQDLYVANMWTAAGERVSMQEGFQRDAPEGIRALYRKHAMGNSLLRNRGGRFENATTFESGGMGRWSWSSDAWDFDHDGYPDLYVANGMISGPIHDDLNSFFWRQVVANSPNGTGKSPEYELGWNAINELIRADYCWSGFERNVFYANHGDGTFSDVSGAVDLDWREDGRAFALADFDHDGRLEVLLKNRNAPQLRLLKNVVPKLPPSIAFRLRGVKSNRDAIGAAVTIETEAGRQTRWVQAGSGFLSQHSKELMFGLGASNGRVRASIRWPSGATQELRDLPVDHRIWAEEGSAKIRSEAFVVARPVVAGKKQAEEVLPAHSDTWLLVPIPAPEPSARGGSRLLTLEAHGLTDDVAAVYNILYRYLFDRRRDLTLPVSLLFNDRGEIVKVYQGSVSKDRVAADLRDIPRTAAERLTRALPFAGESGNYTFGRNNLSLGSLYFQRGYLEQSATFFGLALKDDPASAEAQYGLGSVYLKQQKNAQARASFEEAVKGAAAYPDTLPNAWNNLGLLDARDGRTDRAIECFQQALRASPDYWTALENLGNAYRQQKRWEEARATLERAVAGRPRDAEANYSLAMVFAQTDDTAKASQFLQKALELRPAYPEALNNLGILYLRTKRRAEAVAKFEECIRVDPQFDQAYLNLARVYGVEGAREKARGVLGELLKQHPDHPQAKQMLDQLR
jgi:tetratricopeptide (TPR) repeat protein